MKFLILGLLFCFGAAGGGEHLPPDAAVADYLTRLGFSIVGLAFALIGVADVMGIKGE